MSFDFQPSSECHRGYIHKCLFSYLQVGLSFDEMSCITIDSDDESTVARASGDCAGPTVTLIVADSKRFLVKVYGNDHGHAFTPSKLNA